MYHQHNSHGNIGWRLLLPDSSDSCFLRSLRDDIDSLGDAIQGAVSADVNVTQLVG